MGVPVGDLQYGRTNGTVLDGHVRARQTVIGRRLGLGVRHKFFFVTDRNVTTCVASRSVREARLKIHTKPLLLHRI